MLFTCFLHLLINPGTCPGGSARHGVLPPLRNVTHSSLKGSCLCVCHLMKTYPWYILKRRSPALPLLWALSLPSVSDIVRHCLAYRCNGRGTICSYDGPGICFFMFLVMALSITALPGFLVLTNPSKRQTNFLTETPTKVLCPIMMGLFEHYPGVPFFPQCISSSKRTELITISVLPSAF